MSGVAYAAVCSGLAVHVPACSVASSNLVSGKPDLVLVHVNAAICLIVQ
jgi:hypothetical protein